MQAATEAAHSSLPGKSNVKLLFDENLPPRRADVLQSLWPGRQDEPGNNSPISKDCAKLRKSKFQADLAPAEDRNVRGLKQELQVTSNTDFF
jgi:hypothetical protein